MTLLGQNHTSERSERRIKSNKYIITRLIEKKGKNKVKLPIDWLRTIEIISRIIKRLSDTNERFFIFLGG